MGVDYLAIIRSSNPAVESIFQELRQARVELRSVEGDVELTGPRDVIRQLTPRIREHKAEILARLQADPSAAVAALDAERNEADRQAQRGYDYNVDEPSHPEFVARQEETAKAIGRHCEATGTDLVEYLERFGFRLVEQMEESR